MATSSTLTAKKPLFCLLMSLWFLSDTGYGLSTDKQQVAKIKADSVEYNETTGVSTYIGHIIADQGSTHLTADKVQVYYSKQHQIEQITAHGKPVRYKTLPDGKQQPIEAIADQIIYYPTKGKVILIGHGCVTHNHHQFTGPHIEYYIIAKRILSRPDGQSGTTITLTPGSA